MYSFSEEELKNTNIIELNNVSIKGTMISDNLDEYILSVIVDGIMTLPDSLTLKPIQHSFNIEIDENIEDLLEESPVKVPNKYLIDYYDIYSGMNKYKIPYTYGGENVLTLSPQWVDDGSVTLDIEKQTIKLDNDIGIVSYDSKNNLSYDKSTYNCKGHAQISDRQIKELINMMESAK